VNNNLLKQHWETIYKTKDTINEVSWYQDYSRTSIDLIQSTNVKKDDNIIDIGGGDSKFTDELIELGFKNLFVLDISGKALKKAQKRLGDKAKIITWIESDILKFETDVKFNIWHDRATFHFLTKKEDVAEYIKKTAQFIKPNGFLIIAVFSLNGPEKCSNLDITQYSENSIKKVFNKKFHFIKSFEQIHITPFNTKQTFLWSIFQKVK